MIHPELCQVSPRDSGANLDLPGDWVGGWMALRDEAETMSLDGHSPGVAHRRPEGRGERRTVMYIAVFPNLLVSLHPDYVMAPPPDAAGGRPHLRSSARGVFPEAVARKRGFDPAYAVDFWDMTNRQDWAPASRCSVVFVERARGARAARPRRRTGWSSSWRRIARGYLGQVAGKTRSPST